MAVALKVFASDGNSFHRLTLRPPRGQHWTQLGIKLAMSKYVHSLKQQFPANEFRAVKIARNAYNIIPLNV
jgi:hypothetical protein